MQCSSKNGPETKMAALISLHFPADHVLHPPLAQSLIAAAKTGHRYRAARTRMTGFCDDKKSEKIPQERRHILPAPVFFFP